MDVIFEEGGKWDLYLNTLELKLEVPSQGDEEANIEESKIEYTSEDIKKFDNVNPQVFLEIGESALEE